jgi:pimeloyl-ACP methyl ester carboxylesterase
MIAKGTGFPVAMVTGIQGRWEWMAPTIDAMAAGHRVMSCSLNELRPERESNGSFLAWMRALDRVFDNAHERKVSLIGVSFGGLIAALYAARRPERVTSLVLASPAAPIFVPRRGDGICLTFPRLALPYFGVRALSRLLPELHRSRDSWPLRIQFTLDYAGRVIKAPLSPVLAAQWVREWQAYDISDDCRRITAPTLVITGEPGMDEVVPVAQSLEYLKLIPGARHTVLEGTGHIGIISKPYRFAELAGKFIYDANAAERSGKPAEEAAVRHAS